MNRVSSADLLISEDQELQRRHLPPSVGPMFDRSSFVHCSIFSLAPPGAPWQPTNEPSFPGKFLHLEASEASPSLDQKTKAEIQSLAIFFEWIRMKSGPIVVLPKSTECGYSIFLTHGSSLQELCTCIQCEQISGRDCFFMGACPTFSSPHVCIEFMRVICKSDCSHSADFRKRHARNLVCQ